MLIKSFIDIESWPVIPHLIEEVYDFKKFVEGYLQIGHDALAEHTNAQQFKIYRDGSGWPLMQYKLLCTNNEWLSKEIAQKKVSSFVFGRRQKMGYQRCLLEI